MRLAIFLATCILSKSIDPNFLIEVPKGLFVTTFIIFGLWDVVDSASKWTK